MKIPAKDQISRIISEDVAKFLRGQGFKKNKLNFCRAVGEINWLVSFQLRIVGSSDSREFTLNCGVHMPGIVRAYYGIEEPSRPGIEHCVCYSRIGSLTPLKKDVWWSVESDFTSEDRASVACSVIAALSDFGLPNLYAMQSGLDVVERLVSSTNTNSEQLFPPSRAQKLAYAALICRKIGSLIRSEELFAEAEMVARGTPLEPIIRRLLGRL